MQQPRRLADFGNLTEAEAKVLAGLDDPLLSVLGDGEVPPADAGPDRSVRASFIRWCALGAGDGRRLHEAGLRIVGALVASDGDPLSPGGRGLDLEGCALEADLVLFSCCFEDAPTLRSARLRTLNLQGSHLPGLNADGLEAAGGVFLRQVDATGEVRLVGAKLGGDLVCDGGRFTNKGGDALSADGLEAAGGVFLLQVEATGAARLPGAKLGGDLACDGGRFANEGGFALSAAGLEAAGHVFLRQVDATGEVRLVGAKLGRNLSCIGGRFANNGGDALSADGLEAAGGVFLRQVEATGELRLLGAKLGGDLDCDGGRFANEGGDALHASRLEANGSWFWRGGAAATGVIDLTAASFGAINDDPACWPDAGALRIGRLRYGAFLGLGVAAEDRVRWLALHDPLREGRDFEPQPWEQCAKALREMGHAREARAVLIDKERRQRAAFRTKTRKRLVDAKKRRDDPVTKGWAGDARVYRLQSALFWAHVWDAILGATIDYGLRPLKAGVFLLALWIIGSVVFLAAWQADAMKPNNPFVLRAPEWVACGVTADAGGVRLEGAADVRALRAPDETRLACFQGTARGASFPDFAALVYAADVLFPLVEIEQQANWVPDEDRPMGFFAKITMYVSIVMGWALSLLAVAGFTGLVRSD